MDKKVHYKMHKVKKQWVTIAVTGMSLGAVSAVSLGTNDGVVQADEHTDATVAIPDISVDRSNDNRKGDKKTDIPDDKKKEYRREGRTPSLKGNSIIQNQYESVNCVSTLQFNLNINCFSDLIGKKIEKLEKIALGAAEQSKRNLVPSVTLFEKKSDFLAQLDQFDSIVVAYEESAKEGEAAALLQAVNGLEKGAKLLFIFGPEGGLSPVEIESFEAKGAVLAGLGPRILRAETAPLYALSALSVLLELEK